MGRPKLFDEPQVLNATMSVFWKKGYEATSTKDLCSATQLNPGSIYHRYENKEGLFCLSLEYYIDTIVRDRVADMLSGDNPLEAIEYFFSSAFESVPTKELMGCFLTNTVLDGYIHSEKVSNIVKQGFGKIETGFKEQLIVALERSELSINRDPKAAAIYLLACFQGLMVNSRLTKNKKRLRTITRQTMLTLDASV